MNCTAVSLGLIDLLTPTFDRPAVARRFDAHAVLRRKHLGVGDVVRGGEKQSDPVDQIVIRRRKVTNWK